MTRPVLMIATAAVAAVFAAGCTSQTAQSSGNGHTGHEDSSAVSSATAVADAAGAHNEADVMFAQHMIPHHSQAVEMTDILLAKQGVDPRVVELAKQIKAAQAPEIQQMQGWLASWGNPAMPPMNHGAMQGMVSEADLDKLRNAPGPAATTLYLQQMIAHHEGAIDMAQDEIKDGRYGPAIEMSRAIVSSQQAEIDTMTAILKSS